MYFLATPIVATNFAKSLLNSKCDLD